MKLTVLLLTVGLLQLSAATKAQVTIRAKNTPFRTVLEQISAQSGYDLFYVDQDLNNAKPVNVQLQNAPLAEALKQVFAQQPLHYELSNGTIMVKRRQGDKGSKTNETSSASIQNFVRGRVLDNNGKPLGGVSVGEKDNSKNAVATDVDGSFTIYINPTKAILTFRSTGFTPKEVALQGKTWIEVQLSPTETQIDDVVITGYQNLERKSLTGSIASVNMEQLETIFQPNIDKLLQGQVPGLTVMSTSGAPGAVPQIRIRGTSTLSGNVQPLWVVDGIILDDAVNVSVDDIMTNRNLIASGIGGINVEDIESINVLKDAAATAIYGTRAANGVIVITSKKGKAGKTRINLSSTFSANERPRIEDAYMMNSKERIDVNREMLDRNLFAATSPRPGEYGTVTDFERYFIDASDRRISWEEFEDKVKYLETVNTDWFKHLFRNSFSQRYNLSLSGGDKRTTFYASGSYLDDQATAKGVGQKTYTGSLKVYTNLAKDMRLGAIFDINARDNSSFFAMDSRENPYEWAIYTTRAQPAFGDHGEYSYFYHNTLQYNFMENREQGWRNAHNFGLRSSVDFEWKFYKDLTFSSLFSYTKQNTTDTDIALEDSYFVRSRKKDYYDIIDYVGVQIWHDGGYRKGKQSLNGSITFRNQLMYNPLFKEKHYLNVMVGQEVRKSKTEEEVTQVYGYAHDRGHQQVPQFDLMKKMGIPYWTERLDEAAAVSYFGSANYTYDNRYTVSFNMRTDGSNRFGLKTNQLFQPLWAIGANYQIKEEQFLRDLDWISYLTVKGSYGSQGNVASQAYSDLVATIGAIDIVNPVNYLTINAPKNPYLKWEKTYTRNLGLEFGLWKRRLMGSVEFYHKKGMDLLGSKEVSQVTGFSSLQVNWASMLNKGWEFSLSSINIDTDNFRWSTNVNFGFNRNEVLDVNAKPTVSVLTNATRTNYATSAVVGKPLDGLWSYRYAGLNEEGRATFYTANEDEKVLYGMNKVDGLKYEGSTMPTSQMGFTNTFTYKRFTLSGLLIGSFGNVMRLRNLSAGYGLTFPESTQNLSKEWADRWRVPGDELKTDIPKFENSPWELEVTGASPYNGSMYDNSDLRTVKADFLRLQNLSVSYDYFTPRLRSLGIQNIRLMLQGNNLYVWKNSKLKGQDPEAQGTKMTYSDSRYVQVSVGNTYLPIPRSYTASLQIQF